MESVEIEAKTLIQKSKTPSNDYVINPCTGCVIGCACCFASWARRGATRYRRSRSDRGSAAKTGETWKPAEP